MTTTTPALWVHDGGELACGQHGGAYLATAITLRPDATEHSTPLGTWERVTDVELLRAVFAESGLPEPGCETCAARAERELDATMRAQISSASAQPRDECGDVGHDVADHDVEPSHAQVDLERALRASLR
jgi:hypothetical protein